METTTPLQTTTPENIDIVHDVTFVSIIVNKHGIFSLGLIFVATAIFTISYLQSTVPQIPQGRDRSAQIATAIAPTQATLLDLASTTLTAQAVYVLDVVNNRTLYSLNQDVQLPLASITKVPMILVVSEVLTSDMHIDIPFDTAPKGSTERLVKGDIWRVGDVIDFTLVASSNGGAEILASSANESLSAKYPQASADSATLWRMNNLVKQLGLSKTYFLNVSGLDESTTQAGAYGSAHDVAVLFAYVASTSSEIFTATTYPYYSRTSINGARIIAINTDKALDAIPGIIMGKTGYTDLAGGNLAVVFNVVPGHPIVAVVLGSTEQGRFEDMKKLVSAVQKMIK